MNEEPFTAADAMAEIAADCDPLAELAALYPVRQDGDVDNEQLATAWRVTNETARRRMLRDHERLGYEQVQVHDPVRGARISVWRKRQK